MVSIPNGHGEEVAGEESPATDSPVVTNRRWREWTVIFCGFTMVLTGQCLMEWGAERLVSTDG